ncbi:aspartate/tyrosine/aromatic aminotransferase [Salipaludibacillus sp. CF4.18]|uniref:aspartate/tyrosine/aromatic aminotransferase n=1 Tax=Salipaludibacillus sp. CF4.18 TaxID=3373081 RepID=UPI003EE69517
MAKIAVLYSGVIFQDIEFSKEKYNNIIDLIPIYDLPTLSLDSYIGLIVPRIADEEFLFREKEIIKDFLNQGKIVCSFVQNFRSWLPGNTLWKKTDLNLKDHRVTFKKKHPIFTGVDEYDLNFKEGVAGFFYRGTIEPPSEAEVIIEDHRGYTVMYIDHHSTKGTILSTAGADLLGYAGSTPSTAQNIGPQLFKWIEDEYEEIQKKRGFM